MPGAGGHFRASPPQEARRPYKTLHSPSPLSSRSPPGSGVLSVSPPTGAATAQPAGQADTGSSGSDPSIGERLAVNRFDPRRLVIGQRGEFLLPAPAGKAAAVAVQEPEQKVGQPLRHVDD